MSKTAMFPGVKTGEIFTLAGTEFFRFAEKDGKVAVAPVQPLFRAPIGNCADLKQSDILRRLNDEFLPAIIEAVGEENVCTFTTDLMTLDGLKTYGEIESKICLPTLAFYQANVEVYDLRKTDDWWWLGTAWSAEPNWDSLIFLCVSPSGLIRSYYCGSHVGVRPILIFDSSIFGSSGES